MLVLSMLFLFSVAEAAFLLSFSKTFTHERPSAVSQSLKGTGLKYLIDFELGGQTIEAQLDTGSSDIWVASNKACLGLNNNTLSCSHPYFPDNSNTFVAKSTKFDIIYGDGGRASGFYAQDSLKLGDVAVNGANFAVANSANTSNIFGIGPKYTESCVRWKVASNGSVVLDESKGCSPYDNLPTQMKQQGIIETTAYSIWLEKEIEGNGKVIFGGITPSSIVSSFKRVPIERPPYQVSSNNSYIEYPIPVAPVVLLNELSITYSGRTSMVYQGAFPALLDYGSTLCILPKSITDGIAKNTGMSGKKLKFPCSRNFTGYLTFNFRGVEIEVDLADFIRPEYNNSVQTSTCVMGMLTNEGSDLLILGDNVLSSMYVTMDYDHNEIGLGQATAKIGEDMIEIPIGGIPAPKAPNYDTEYLYTFVN